MLEETNDNLLEADGNLESNLPEMIQTETAVLEELNTIETSNEETVEPIKAVASKTANSELKATEALVEDETLVVSETPVLEELEIVESSNREIPEQLEEMPSTTSNGELKDTEALVEDETLVVSETPVLEELEIVESNNIEIEELVEETINTVSDGEPSDTEQAKQLQDNNTIIDAIADINAAESEDVTLKERHDIPMLDYDTLSIESLVDELKNLVTNEKVMSVKEHIEEIKKSFLAKYYHLLEEKKEEFIAESQNLGTEIKEEFHYHSPLKTQFDQFYSLFRDNKNTHFKSLQTNLKTNLENRLAIVEELKELINPQANIKDTLKHFNDLRERWKNAGPIPKDKYNHVWNNYHFHVENFYDYLHLDREARDLDFKHNLEQKQKIVARVEELVNEADINKAFRELQDLHKIWKEDIGPVSREHRDEIWNKFSDLTKQMHDKREVLFENLRGTELENLEKKKEIIAKIEVLATEKVNAHSQWLAQIEKVEALRTAFFSAGKVPSEVNEETWAGFKTAVRNFNSFKNSFYKDIKKDQNSNLTRKTALVAKAKELQESTDFAVTTPIMKQIQEEWKQIGHVPRKYSDKIWTEFKEACNHYFDKLKEQKNEENGEEVEAFDKKKAYIETLREFQLSGDHKTDLDAIKLHIETWKSFGRVPFARRHIEGKFNKILDILFEKLSLSKKDTEMMRFANRMDHLSENNDTRKLEGEKIFLMRKIDEIKNEIFQLENNIQFFTNTRNAKKENSIVLEVRKNIEKHKEEMEILKDKLKQIRSLNQA